MLHKLLIMLLLAPFAAYAQNRDIGGYLTHIPSKGYLPNDMQQAIEMINKGSYDSVSDFINTTQAKHRHPVYPDRVALVQGLIAAHKGELETAQQYFVTGIKEKPSNSDLLFLNALLLNDVTKRKEKISILNDALWFNRFSIIDSIECYTELAKSLIEDQQNAAAATLLAKAVFNFPKSIALQNNLAELYLSQGKKPEAVSLLRNTLKLEPENRNTQLKLAQALLLGVNRQFDKSDILEAKRLASNVVTENPADNAMITYIRALTENGEIGIAKSYLSKAMAYSPQDPILLNLSKQLEIEGAASQQPNNTKEKSSTAPN